jgi:hypothetical protein
MYNSSNFECRKMILKLARTTRKVSYTIQESFHFGNLRGGKVHQAQQGLQKTVASVGHSKHWSKLYHLGGKTLGPERLRAVTGQKML